MECKRCKALGLNPVGPVSIRPLCKDPLCLRHYVIVSKGHDLETRNIKGLLAFKKANNPIEKLSLNFHYHNNLSIVGEQEYNTQVIMNGDVPRIERIPRSQEEIRKEVKKRPNKREQEKHQKLAEKIREEIYDRLGFYKSDVRSIYQWV